MRIAIVGCGFVADLYLSTIKLHPELELVAVFDRDERRMREFAKHHDVPSEMSLHALLARSDVDIVVNLTNPHSHAEITEAALLAGKHVYSEKPLALKFQEAERLVDLAERENLYLAGAPCTLLSQTAQTLWREVRNDTAGKIRLVYAEMDEGLIHRFQFRKWMSSSGAPWPYRDEFQVGCTLEHAGYCLTWLLAIFGPVQSVTAFSSILVDSKVDGEPLKSAPDFSVASIKFENGVVARMTNSIVAPHDHRIRFFGDSGVLYTTDSWSSNSPVRYRDWKTIRRRTFLNPIPRRIKLLKSGLSNPGAGGSQRIDFVGGISELADSIAADRDCRLNGRFCLHVTELSLAINNATEHSSTYIMRSTFDPIEPLHWSMN